MDDLTAIGDVLVRFSARTESSDAMVVQLREIHTQFADDLDAQGAYFRMGFLCAKAIERAHLLEGALHVASDDRCHNCGFDPGRVPPARPSERRPGDAGRRDFIDRYRDERD